ncbi:MAG: hypothetical protein M1817_001305 [Caeruleum heppii]|nr:MAG: hypothetical protein M1817_001305 [Caeruleum heppii]
MPGPTTRILLIAGSDSSGGAGLEADQRVLAVHQCYAMTATTALTAQNTLGVYDIHHTPTDFVKKQIDACAIDIGIDVVKTGTSLRLDDAALAIKNVLAETGSQVMVATSGAQLLPQAAVRALRTELLPLTTILTPNIPEARLLLQDAGQSVPEPRNIGDLVEITEAVRALGPKYVLLKGGHSPLSRDDQVAAADEDRAYVVDVLCGDGQPMYIRSEFLRSRSTHGTGCSLACKSSVFDRWSAH